MTAGCDRNPDLFFSDDPADIEAAKFLCEECPLSRFRACQQQGWGEEFGVFGGLSHHDRQALDPDRFARLVSARDDRATRTDRGIVKAREVAADLVAVSASVATPASPKAKALDMLARGFTSPEVSEATGVKPGTVRQWARRSRLS